MVDELGLNGQVTQAVCCTEGGLHDGHDIDERFAGLSVVGRQAKE